MKTCLITHIADEDGAFPIVLAKLVLDNIDIISCDVLEVDEKLNSILDKNYEKIYIVDLNVSDLMAEKINSSELKNIVEIYDHHESKEHLNKYSFENVVVKNELHYECGSTLFYKHLKEITDNEILERQSLKEILEMIRENDTYDFIDKEQALKFSSLYAIYGRENFIEYCIKFIKENENFYFSETEELLIKLDKEKTDKYIKEKIDHIKFAYYDNYKLGIVFAESYRSLLGNEIVNRFSDVDISVVINVDRSVSYRSVKDTAKTTDISVKLNGGGHFHASGSPIPVDLEDKIIESIFKDIRWDKNASKND